MVDTNTIFLFWHPKQVKQQSQYGGGGLFGSDGLNLLFWKTKFIVYFISRCRTKSFYWQKGRNHGVQLFFKYAGGFTLGILKPYLVEVVDPTSIVGNTFFKYSYIRLQPDNPNSLF
ncbi:MAG: hypothetical protein IPL21_18255 [Saprospirales bacterium]|nr:hypothetical protein [Saprospirales bacterium]